MSEKCLPCADLETGATATPTASIPPKPSSLSSRQVFNLIIKFRSFIGSPPYGGWNSIWIAENGP
jgi:hypothetical protein